MSTPRQEQLFDDLVVLLLAEGFAALTLDGLAARLRCSKRTLYALADSKDELVVRVVKHFFKGATERVERALAEADDPIDRVDAYLRAVSVELTPASARFFDDLAGLPPAAAEYERNTRSAAERVRRLVDDGMAAGAFRRVHAAFVADVVTGVMVRIQQRRLAESTGLSDAEAYANLAELLLHGLAASHWRTDTALGDSAGRSEPHVGRSAAAISAACDYCVLRAPARVPPVLQGRAPAAVARIPLHPGGRRPTTRRSAVQRGQFTALAMFTRIEQRLR